HHDAGGIARQAVHLAVQRLLPGCRCEGVVGARQRPAAGQQIEEQANRPCVGGDQYPRGPLHPAGNAVGNGIGDDEGDAGCRQREPDDHGPVEHGVILSRRWVSVGVMSAAQREFDIVLYGATGFVGKLTAQYLAKAGGDARIALAGRSQDKLLAVRETLGEKAQSWPLITADASQPSTLNAMAARAQVVVTTVGPYAKYGLPLVAACAAAGTDYADLTGEAMFMRESIDLYHKQAIDTGARIVHSCGFDSIPSDLTVYALHRRATEDSAGELMDTTFVVRKLVGGFSGVTYASIAGVIRAMAGDAQVRRSLEDPYTLTPDRDAEPELGAQSDIPWRRGRDIA